MSLVKLFGTVYVDLYMAWKCLLTSDEAFCYSMSTQCRFHANTAIKVSYDHQNSALLNSLNSLRKPIQNLQCLVSCSPTCLINSIIQEHLCNTLI